MDDNRKIEDRGDGGTETVRSQSGPEGPPDAAPLGDNVFTNDACLEAVINAVQDGVCVIDADCRVLTANGAVHERYGNGVELRGKLCCEIYRTRVDPCDECPVSEVFQTGRTLNGHVEIREVESGDVRRLAIKSVPVVDRRSGRICGVAEYIRDITAEKKTDERLRLLSTAVEQSIEGVAVVDLDGYLLYLNRAFAEMHGYSRAELIGRHLSIFHRAEQMPVVEAANELIRSQGYFVGEIWHVRHDGTPFPTLMHNSLVLDEAGKPIAMTGTARDISDLVAARTELREAKERAEAANTAKSRFLATMSHELRTPLNAVIGFSELLQDEVLGPLTGRRARAVRHILQSGRHLLRLVNDLLDLSGIEAGKVTVRRTPINLTSILSECVDFFLEPGRKRCINIVFLPSDDLDETEWFGDEVRIKQIVFNVLSNALKFTPEGGKIRMTARREDDRAVISVSDTGRGIRPKDMSRIFEVFEQADDSYAREESGMGIGLAVTRRLVELHNGTIRVESEGAGKGSTFHIELPLARSFGDAS